MKTALPLLALSCALLSGAKAQTLKEFHGVGNMSADNLNAGAANLFGATGLPKTSTPVKLYRVSYYSTAGGARKANVSGLLVIPVGGAPNGLIVWNHGTIGDRDNAPSNYRPGVTTGSDRTAILGFATGGYAVALPDYFGFGDDTASHPYPLGKINARSALDIIDPARSIGDKLKYPIGPHTLITGYSEGGAVAMWATRLLQEKGTPAFRSAALSGPYDVSNTTVQSVLVKPQNDLQLGGEIFLLGLMVEGFAAQRPAVYEDFFKPAMALTVRKNFGRSVSETDLIARVLVTAKLMRAKTVQDVLTPKFYQALNAADSSNLLVAQLKASDIVEWTPTSPLLLFALESDSVVVARNTVLASKAFRRRNVPDTVSRTLMYQDTNLNHGTTVPRAVLTARRFFDGGFAAVPKAQ